MRRCKYYSTEVTLPCCYLRLKPTDCKGDKTQCWFPELLRKVSSVGAQKKGEKKLDRDK